MAASTGSSAGASGLRAVTPANADLPNGTCRAIWVGGAGDVAVLAEDDASAVTIVAVPAGTLLPIRAKRINLTNTSATSIVALY